MLIKRVANPRIYSKTRYSCVVTSIRQCSGSVEKIRNQFGAMQVDPLKKQTLVNEVFNDVAKRYDIMNDLMSCGLHRCWKDELISMLSPSPDTDLLDVAGGTGDIAFRFCRYHKPEDFTGSVTVCDISSKMIDIGKMRSHNVPNAEKIKWVEGNAEQLPFPDNSFSAYTISFGIRNVTNIRECLKEAKRVLKPGGRFLCLELSKVRYKNLQPLYTIYKNEVIPFMAHMFFNDEKNYRYLAESIDNFPSQDEFAQIIRECGFQFVTVRDFTFGVVAIHSAFAF